MDNPTPQGDEQTKALLEGMRRLGYQVINVGEREIRGGYEAFQAQTAGTPFKYISANLVNQETQAPVFEPHALLEYKLPKGAKLRVGVIGVLRYNPIFLKAGPDGQNMVIVHPVERVKKEVEALRAKKADVIVLLAALNKNDAISIAQSVGGIDFVLGSYGGVYTQPGEAEGKTSIQYCGNRGQRIGETRLFVEGGKKETSVTSTTHMHFLTREYPADQETLDFVNSVVKKPALTGTQPQPAEVPHPVLPGSR